MSNAPTEQRLIVVHIASKRAVRATAQDVIAWLNELPAAVPCVVETCSDVYRALARIGRDHKRPVRAVVVCADDLTPVEQEFFAIAPRVRRGLALGVYGVGRTRVERSRALGAREIDSPEALNALVRLPDTGTTQERLVETMPAPSSVDEAEAAQEPAASVEGGASVVEAKPAPDNPPVATEAPLAPETDQARNTSNPPVVVTEPSDDDSCAEHETDSDSDAQDSTSADTARVPWLTYDGGPQRAGPHRTPPKTDADVTGDAGTHGPAKPYEPLLTDQELRALIGDDLASLGPERGARDADAEEA